MGSCLAAVQKIHPNLDLEKKTKKTCDQEPFLQTQTNESNGVYTVQFVSIESCFFIVFAIVHEWRIFSIVSIVFVFAIAWNMFNGRI